MPLRHCYGMVERMPLRHGGKNATKALGGGSHSRAVNQNSIFQGNNTHTFCIRQLDCIVKSMCLDSRLGSHSMNPLSGTRSHLVYM